jgi:hypothetical protein
MPKAGKIDEITTKDASFEGSGIEGQKAAPAAEEAEESTPAAEEAEETTPAAEEAEESTPVAEEAEETASPFDEPEEVAESESFKNTSYVVTNRNGRPQKIYFRDGKEVGSADV